MGAAGATPIPGDQRVCYEAKSFFAYGRHELQTRASEKPIEGSALNS